MKKMERKKLNEIKKNEKVLRKKIKLNNRKYGFEMKSITHIEFFFSFYT